MVCILSLRFDGIWVRKLGWTNSGSINFLEFIFVVECVEAMQKGTVLLFKFYVFYHTAKWLLVYVEFHFLVFLHMVLVVNVEVLAVNYWLRSFLHFLEVCLDKQLIQWIHVILGRVESSLGLVMTLSYFLFVIIIIYVCFAVCFV